MEDILASIRRILSEDETPVPEAVAPPSQTAPPGERAASDPVASDGVLVLDPAMMVARPPERAVVAPEPEPDPEPEPEPVHAPQPERAAAEIDLQALIGPVAAAAATSAVNNLVRTLAAERTMQVYSGGPTIEDVVREEVRPLLKAWLDEHLPPMVERLVRVEIERVVGRVAP
jgi:uncharacterized protein